VARKTLAVGANRRHIYPFAGLNSMSKINAICVYCGSSPGTDPAFAEAARDFGKIIAGNGIRLIYGGGSIGLMGALATSVIEHGGAVTGIIPEFLTAKERPRRLARDLIITRNMHERKWKMFELADAFVALPGGIGTLEELVEQLTWLQLGRHRKPVLLANINNFWGPLIEIIDHMRALGFIHSERQFNYLIADRVEDVIPKLSAYWAAVQPELTAEEKEVIERL
jgi:uncharacterized protein (TIGR00730 family)